MREEAQFVSEIQGGSDVPANLAEAVDESGRWRIYGRKFFCSAAHADYAVVTAKPRGSERVGCFVVPMCREADHRRQLQAVPGFHKAARRAGSRLENAGARGFEEETFHRAPAGYDAEDHGGFRRQ
jgi:alkylation response protein AidB-like acyl-CoA dehydrogenase